MRRWSSLLNKAAGDAGERAEKPEGRVEWKVNECIVAVRAASPLGLGNDDRVNSFQVVKEIRLVCLDL